MNLLKTFSSESRKSLATLLSGNCAKENVHLIIGNEACDLDSAVSAILYAWFCDRLQCSANLDNQQHEKHINFIPTMSIHHREMRIRNETKCFFNRFHIEQPSLLFLKENSLFNLDKINEFKNFQVTLVDHHVLPRDYEYLEPYVVEIIDHRQQQKDFPASVQVEITTVGSCTTLIAERILKALENNSITLTEQEKKILFLALSAPILIDTIDLLPAAGKVTPRDVNVIEKLQQHVSSSDMHSFYTSLDQSKFCPDGFTLSDHLIKDAKYINDTNSECFAMFSSFIITWEHFLGLGDVGKVIKDHCKSNKKNLWVGLAQLASDENNLPYKTIIIYSDNKQLQAQVVDDLKTCFPPDLEVKDDKRSLTDVHVMRMYNIKASRKQVLPVVQMSINKFHENVKTG